MWLEKSFPRGDQFLGQCSPPGNSSPAPPLGPIQAPAFPEDDPAPPALASFVSYITENIPISQRACLLLLPLTFLLHPHHENLVHVLPKTLQVALVHSVHPVLLKGRLSHDLLLLLHPQSPLLGFPIRMRHVLISTSPVHCHPASCNCSEQDHSGAVGPGSPILRLCSQPLDWCGGASCPSGLSQASREGPSSI